MLAFWNSPPYWMTASGCSSGSAEKGANNLREDQVEAFAEHMCQVLLHYRDQWGLSFKYVCPINEPEVGYWSVDSGQEGCNVDAAQASRIFAALAEAMRRNGVDGRIQGPEAAASKSVDYLDAILRDPKAAEALSVLTCHQYWVDEHSMRRWAQRARQRNKPLWMSEWGDWSNKGIVQALGYARQVLSAHRNMLAEVWCMWEPANLFEKKDRSLERRDSFYAVAHFSRFLTPGMRMIGAVSNELKANAYLDEGNKRFVAVCVNSREDEIRLALDLSRFVGIKSLEAWRTSISERMVQIPEIRKRKTSVFLPAQSILTLVGRYESLSNDALVINPGFEEGEAAGWTFSEGAGIEESYPAGGYSDAFLHPRNDLPARLQQTVEGLRPGKRYVLGASCATSGIEARLGVRTKKAQVSVQAQGKGYAVRTVTFEADRDGAAEVFYEATASGAEEEPP